MLAQIVPTFAARGLSGGTDEATDRQRNVGTSKILARYKGSTISLQAAVHLGHMPRALMTKKKKRGVISQKNNLNQQRCYKSFFCYYIPKSGDMSHGADPSSRGGALQSRYVPMYVASVNSNTLTHTMNRQKRQG
jgi:hypothetical protein